ncbi:MAG: single-stranded-DNA-specific exonuclease RecJ [Caulobacteraceae bacterium]
MTTTEPGHEPAFLGIEKSLSGRAWRERPADRTVTDDHRRRLSLCEPVARALAARGVAADAGELFLRPTLKDLFPDPASFADMNLAAEVLVDALQHGAKVVVFADYDVDGAASAALLMRWFRAMGQELDLYVPDRMNEGYGPTPAAFRRLKAGGADLVVTVDCGAAAGAALEAAQAIDLPVVVIDHHLMGERPPARAVVNPNRADCRSGQGILAAAGVTFVLLTALNQEARRRGLFDARDAPDPRRWLYLAALGAICDVTPFTGFNRALVVRGLTVMSRWANPGLAALLDVAGAPLGPAKVFDAGFILGPRINAGGRIGRSDLGARLLATDDAAEARVLAIELDGLNARRREVEDVVLREAIASVERQSNLDPSASVLIVAGDDWHPGVIGIVASRLRERYRKPVIVVGIDRAAGIGRGSGRSQSGVNLGQMVRAALDAGLILGGGGHAMAAGLTVKPDTLPELRAFLATHEIGRQAGEADDTLHVDVLTTAGGAKGIHGVFEALAPFGPGNPEPVFALGDVMAADVTEMRGGHLRASLIDSAGARLPAIAWRSADTVVGRRLAAGGGAVHVAGRLRRDTWRGRDQMLLEVEDIADPRCC